MKKTARNRAAERRHFAALAECARAGDCDAQYALAAAYATGEGGRKNLTQAVRWYRKAAKSGHGEAQYNLALMYWFADGVHRDVERCHAWMAKAARNREMWALRLLSEAYRDGVFGYRKNTRSAKHWTALYKKAMRS